MARTPPAPIDHNVPQALVGKGPSNPHQYPEANLWGPFALDTSDGGHFVGAAMRFEWNFADGVEEVSFSNAGGTHGVPIYTVTAPPQVSGDTMTFDTAEHGEVVVRPLIAADWLDATSDVEARDKASDFFGLRREGVAAQQRSTLSAVIPPNAPRGIIANMPGPSIPQYHELMWPALTALKELGGSATVKEIYEQVVEDQHFSEEQQAVSTKDGRMSEIQYRLHWARTHLKGIGAANNSIRGVWAITEKGKTMTPDEMDSATKAWRAEIQLRAKEKQQHEEDGNSDEELSWKDQLIERLLTVSPAGFERLAQRILREAGFANVTVLGRSGDGGLDGVGVYRLSLVSFPVYFQCKRYKGSVTAGAVRDFRGAMSGRGEKGLLLTTGSFTKEAQNEANRDGAPPVEVIDGDALCDLLREFRLGVEVRQRIEEDVVLDPGFFEEYV